MHSPDGVAAWEVLLRSAGQVRAAIGGVYALDFAAVLMLAEAMDALNPLLIEALPEIEPIIVRAYARES
jgi:voltage-gated potassium channel Kch